MTSSPEKLAPGDAARTGSDPIGGAPAGSDPIGSDPNGPDPIGRFWRGRVLLISLLAGIALAVLWSAQLVDDDIGLNTANGLLGHNAEQASLTGTVTGLIFAFVTGLAGTFTACNVAVFSAVTPSIKERPTIGGRLAAVLRPLGWIALGASVVAGCYGVLCALVGTRLPQLSTATTGSHHTPVRLVQSIVVFGLIGVVMLYLGCAALGLASAPINRLTAAWPATPQLIMGVLVGGFLIGRPWPLFHKMLAHAASTHNVAFGAAAMILVTLGNLLLMGVFLLLLAGTRLPRWLRRSRQRMAAATAAAWLIGGAFTLVYWDVRVPAKLGFGWFPSMPWH